MGRYFSRPFAALLAGVMVGFVALYVSAASGLDSANSDTIGNGAPGLSRQSVDALSPAVPAVGSSAEIAAVNAEGSGSDADVAQVVEDAISAESRDSSSDEPVSPSLERSVSADESRSLGATQDPLLEGSVADDDDDISSLFDFSLVPPSTSDDLRTVPSSAATSSSTNRVVTTATPSRPQPTANSSAVGSAVVGSPAIGRTTATDPRTTPTVAPRTPATTASRTPNTVAPRTATIGAPRTTTTAAPRTTITAAPRTTTTAAPRPTTTTTTTAAPRTTTTAAARPAATSGASSIFSAPVEGLSPFGFGQTQSEVTRALSAQFGDLRYVHPSNWEDFSVVSDSGGDYLRVRSDVGSNSQKQFNAPIEPSQETYLVYQFYLEPGFDAGDGNNSDGSPSWGTGIKLPGLMRGNPGDNTGGNHTAGGFSGRLMIRGTNSDGLNGAPRDGLSLAAYVYGQEIDNQNIASGFGEDYYFLDGFDSEPFEGITGGTHEGVGDPRIWELQTGKWVTVVLGYRVDGDNGFFKAWTKTGNSALTENLHIPNVNWTGGNSTAGADSILFQNFWGGKGSVWYPDSVSYMRYRNFDVFTSQADALAAAR